MIRNDYLLIARAINRAKKKKIPAHLMFYQIPMEIAASILQEDKTFDYREFFKECNK
jgi:predicted hydrocarbon binding protein